MNRTPAFACSAIQYDYKRNVSQQDHLSYLVRLSCIFVQPWIVGIIQNVVNICFCILNKRVPF